MRPLPWSIPLLGRAFPYKQTENAARTRPLSQDSIFIDIMMNVGIIFYAAQQTKDPSLRQIAVDHCLTTRRFGCGAMLALHTEASLIPKPASF